MSEYTGKAPLPTELEALVQPFDDLNKELLDNVHPLDWTNPKPADRYHLVVIGGGTAGLVSAAAAAGLGGRVALIEKRMMGGDCLNYGCVPSKALISAARAWRSAKTGQRRFGAPAVSDAGDFGAAMERMRRLRAQNKSSRQRDSLQRSRHRRVHRRGQVRWTRHGRGRGRSIEVPSCHHRHRCTSDGVADSRSR